MQCLERITINSHNHIYDVYIGKSIISEIFNIHKEFLINKKVIIITDKNVYKIYHKYIFDEFCKIGCESKFIILDPGENSKDLENIYRIYKELIEFKVKRTDVIIAFGGGVVGDISGFIASTYLRGVDYVQIPTTLLSQVDSSIGGKVAVNFMKIKNVVGSFYNPRFVIIDIDLLSTLRKEQIIDGLGEIIKYSFISDEGLIQTLEEHDLNTIKDCFLKIIIDCIKIKKYYVEKDPYDLNERKILNFGHTFAHAMESYLGYENISHGMAVGFGIYILLKNCNALGIISCSLFKRCLNLLNKYNVLRQEGLDTKHILDYAYKDKKSSNKEIDIILLHDIGKPYIKRIGLDELNIYLS